MERRGELAFLRGLALPLVLAAGALAPAEARVLLTQPEALEAAFPGQRLERRVAYLSRKQVAAVQERARARLRSSIVAYYVGRSSEGVTGFAYFDTHVVRSMPETLMVLLSPAGEVRSVEVLAFHEPEDYLPRPRWLKQFRGRSREQEVWLKRDIRGVTGATLTAHAVTEAVRRILALHAELHRTGEP